MVIIETALIGTAGYAAWRGGEKAVHVGSRKMEDMKRDRRRNEKQRDYNEKSRERSTRLSEIQDRIVTARAGGGGTSVTTSATLGSSGSSGDADNNNNNSTRVALAAHDDRLQKERFNSIKERYGSVRGKSTKKSGGLFGRFKKTSTK